MPEYAVFSSQILTGTISDLPYPTRLAWQAILFEAEKLRGKVKLPVRVLAKKASITTEEAAAAIETFIAPDPFSSSKEDDGRRLRRIEGEEDWYVLVTWEKHAKERAAYFNRLRQQRWREKNKRDDDPPPRVEREDHEIVRSVLAQIAPKMREPEGPYVNQWLSAAGDDPWVLCAALVEKAEHLARASSPLYVSKLVREIGDEQWEVYSKCDAEEFVAYRLKRSNEKTPETALESTNERQAIPTHGPIRVRGVARRRSGKGNGHDDSEVLQSASGEQSASRKRKRVTLRNGQ